MINDNDDGMRITWAEVHGLMLVRHLYQLGQYAWHSTALRQVQHDLPHAVRRGWVELSKQDAMRLTSKGRHLAKILWGNG
jgi:hypothetical protein